MSTCAPLFQIVNGSFVDGPGVRTTIFLKGCPLRCRWCCNPEGQQFRPELKFIAEHCNGCGKCVGLCPRGALRVEDGALQIDRAECDGCGLCEDACWFGALELLGRPVSAETIFAQLAKSRAFFESSGGGLTIGGGEATCFPEFCLELIGLCHDSGIHVAVDTCGQVTTQAGLKVLREADLLLFDVKGLDAENHRRNTGVDNSTILKNLREMDDLGKPIIVRYPIIPTLNASEIEAVADYLTSLKSLTRVDLIPYHRFGATKYPQLGMEYELDIDEFSEAEKAGFLEVFLARGLPAQLGG